MTKKKRAPFVVLRNYVVNKEFKFSGRLYTVGDDFCWGRIACDLRKLRQLYEARYISIPEGEEKELTGEDVNTPDNSDLSSSPEMNSGSSNDQDEDDGQGDDSDDDSDDRDESEDDLDETSGDDQLSDDDESSDDNEEETPVEEERLKTSKKSKKDKKKKPLDLPSVKK